MRFKTIILDFDSTLISIESLDLLAEISLAHHPERQERLERIRQLTTMAMEGEMPYHSSLTQRIALLEGHAYHLPELIDALRKYYTPSLLRALPILRDSPVDFYVFSGGFSEYIIPVLHSIGFPAERIYANRFVADASGKILGVDTTNPLATTQGKAKLAARLQLRRPILVVGDGYNDYEIRKLGYADAFAAFVENIYRRSVCAHADFLLHSFHQLLSYVETTASIKK